MKKRHRRLLFSLFMFGIGFIGIGFNSTAMSEPITIAEQGSFFVGGKTISSPGTFDPTKFAKTEEGQSFPVDHLYVQYQIPLNPKKLPIVMVHGKGQTGKTYETTPDGREGFRTIFLRKGYSVYVVDFPRRGRAGIPTFTGPFGEIDGNTYIDINKNRRFSNEETFPFFRLGDELGKYYPDTAFGKNGLNQFEQQNIASVADDPQVISDALAALVDKIGPVILLTHSQSGYFGWLTRIKSKNVKAIITYEPGPPKGLIFPEGEAPKPRKLFNGALLTHATEVPLQDYKKLTEIPIQIINGDHIPIPTEPVSNLYLDFWRVRTMDVVDFAKTINEHGGDASILNLPDVGLKGNTHFPMSDVNNVKVADLLSDYLKEKGLDK